MDSRVEQLEKRVAELEKNMLLATKALEVMGGNFNTTRETMEKLFKSMQYFGALVFSYTGSYHELEKRVVEELREIRETGINQEKDDKTEKTITTVSNQKFDDELGGL